MSADELERVGARTVFDGRIMTVRVERFRYPDGGEAEREIVRSAGAVGIVAVDDRHLWLVRQPRETFLDAASLELPAGRLDKPGEAPLQAARRELAEEVGKAAARWTPLHHYRSSIGMTDETVQLFLAEDLTDLDAPQDSGEEERIEIVPWPLAELEDLVERARDAKTVIGALLLLRRLGR